MSNHPPPTVDHAPPPKQGFWRPKKLSAIRIALLAFPGCYLVLFFSWPSGFGYWQVCTTCGQIERVTRQQLPLTGITYRTTRRTQPTALSRELTRLSIRSTHIHNWEFGSGNGIGFSRSCALGHGHTLLNVVDRPYVAKFIGQLSKNADAGSVDQWLNLLLDPATASAAERAIVLNDFPEKGFATDSDFVQWWTKRRMQMLKEVHGSK